LQREINKVEENTVVLTFQAEIESHLDGRVFNYTVIEGALDLSLDGGTDDRTPPIVEFSVLGSKN